MMSNKFNKPQSSVTLVEEEINLNKGSKSLPATLLGSPITTPDSSPPSTCVQYRRIAVISPSGDAFLKLQSIRLKRTCHFFLENANVFARYVSICQSARIVPIVSPKSFLMAFKFTEASSSDCPPLKKVTGTIK
ncbi:fructose-bisphosphate aldolase C-A-like [Polistes fuscatus]|uniref:fructose-bisphosphate aldolase C-A-like n=1 Tax=Polistes fuscatus TaxID=30207 RepID=UPI001CA8D26D|nr:fructose-bisphosphate aldolase C-A-like [Polistes fuscatus]